MNIIVSFGASKGYIAAVVSKDGELSFNHTERLKTDETDYRMANIEAFNVALRLTRQFAQDNPDYDEFTFEFSDSVLANWLSCGCSVDNYRDAVEKAGRLLQSIPIRYNFVVVKKPRAIAYCKEEYISRAKLGGLL